MHRLESTTTPVAVVGRRDTPATSPLKNGVAAITSASTRIRVICIVNASSIHNPR